MCGTPLSAAEVSGISVNKLERKAVENQCSFKDWDRSLERIDTRNPKMIAKRRQGVRRGEEILKKKES